MATFKKTGFPARRGGPPAPMGSFAVADPRCKVCKHPQRREIDMMLALGWSRAEVRRYWNDIVASESGGEETDYFKKSSVENHAAKHLSAHDAAVRRIVERRAELEGIDVAAVEGFILTKSGVAEALIQKGLQSVHTGDTLVEPKDMLSAIQVLIELEEKRSVVAEEVMLREIRAFMAAVKNNVDEDLWDQIYADYKAELGERPAAALPTAPSNNDPDTVEED
jgi:hypothetical protein